MRRRDDRRGCGRDSPRGGPQSLQGGDGKARTRHAEVRKRPLARRSRGDRKGNRHMAAHHPPRLHARRNGRWNRAQRGRVPRNRLARTRGVAQPRGPCRGVSHRLEGIRDGGHARQGWKCRDRLLNREHGRNGRPYRRLDHRRADTDTYRPRIPGDARRLDPRSRGDRNRDGRLERPVGGQSEDGTAHHHRDESARLALLRARLEGDGLPDREDRRPSRRGLYARRAEERHHRSDARLLRACARLCRRQGAALHVREIPRCRQTSRHADEVRGRGNGNRTHLQAGVPEGRPLA